MGSWDVVGFWSVAYPSATKFCFQHENVAQLNVDHGAPCNIYVVIFVHGIWRDIEEWLECHKYKEV